MSHERLWVLFGVFLVAAVASQVEAVSRTLKYRIGGYEGDKAAHVSSKFTANNWKHKPGFNGRWDYDVWSDAAQRDGFLCRSSSDCTWMDPNLECDGHNPTVSPSAAWFGGDVASINGTCQCKETSWWNNGVLQCQQFEVDAAENNLVWWEILLIVLAVLVALCICCFCFAIRNDA